VRNDEDLCAGLPLPGTPTSTTKPAAAPHGGLCPFQGLLLDGELRKHAELAVAVDRAVERVDAVLE
jgi:hypothetical protein